MTPTHLCRWRYDEAMDLWGTDCGHEYVLYEGTPDQNELQYCCYCGGNLAEAEGDHA